MHLNMEEGGHGQPGAQKPTTTPAAGDSRRRGSVRKCMGSANPAPGCWEFFHSIALPFIYLHVPDSAAWNYVCNPAMTHNKEKGKKTFKKTRHKWFKNWNSVIHCVICYYAISIYYLKCAWILVEDRCKFVRWLNRLHLGWLTHCYFYNWVSAHL